MQPKQYISLKSIRNEYEFTFHMPIGCTWGNSLDAAYDIIEQVMQLTKQALENSKCKPENECLTTESSGE